MPVTIANGGARDGAVVSMRLDAKDPETGKTARFYAAYTVDARYFAGASGSAERPKTPFAALAIAGRSSWSGTVLFLLCRLQAGEADQAQGQDRRVAPSRHGRPERLD